MAIKRDKQGRFMSKKKQKSKKSKGKPTPTTKKKVEKKIQERIALVLDSSGSMKSHKSGLIRMFNEQIDQIRKENPSAEISLVLLGEKDKPTRVAYANVGVSQVSQLKETTYHPHGQTPLFDAVHEAVDALSSDESKGKHYSYLVLTLTDGEENASRIPLSQFASLIKDKQATDRWTFAFMVPKGYKDRFRNLSGVHDGNIMEWDHITDAASAATRGYSIHTQAVVTGKKMSSTSYFTTNASQVSKKDFSKLPDVTKNVKVWSVDKETSIKEFVESHSGVAFAIGAGYYQLTKPEEVQSHKDVLLMRKGEREVRAEGRELLGLPDYTVKVTPGNHGDYDIFVQSTSNNRKLVRGTKFIYKVK
jgi:uncharacterized protein YegL